MMNYMPLYRRIFTNTKVDSIRSKHGNDGMVVWLYFCGQVIERIESGIYDFKLMCQPRIAATTCMVTEDQLKNITISLLETNLLQEKDGALFLLQMAKYIAQSSVAQSKRSELGASKQSAITTYESTKEKSLLNNDLETFIGVERTVMTNHDMSCIKKERKKERQLRNSCASQQASVLFEEFYKTYDKKKDRKRSITVWNRLVKTEELARKIIDHVKLRNKSDPQWTKENGKFKPHPATFLNGECWEDEYASESLLSVAEPINILEWTEADD